MIIFHHKMLAQKCWPWSYFCFVRNRCGYAVACVSVLPAFLSQAQKQRTTRDVGSSWNLAGVMDTKPGFVLMAVTFASQKRPTIHKSNSQLRSDDLTTSLSDDTGMSCLRSMNQGSGLAWHKRFPSWLALAMAMIIRASSLIFTEHPEYGRA